MRMLTTRVIVTLAATLAHHLHAIGNLMLKNRIRNDAFEIFPLTKKKIELLSGHTD